MAIASPDNVGARRSSWDGNLSGVPRFEPFRALRYSPDIEPLDALVAPPYDVLSAEDVAEYGAKSPHNIVHVDVPAGGAERYARAGALLRQWIADGVLAADDEPSFTVYRMRFIDATGARRDLVGVIGALEVVDEGAGGVLPHERTTPKASTDRLDLTRATRANLSPVWGLSLAAGLSDLLGAPGELVGEVTVDGVVHRVERVSDPERMATIGDRVSGDDVLIADGHHRYGVARIYRDEIRDAASRTDDDDPAESAELTLAFVGELIAEQLSVEAIHRLYTGIEPADLQRSPGRALRRSSRCRRRRQRPWPRWSPRDSSCSSAAARRHRLTPKPGAFDGVRALDGAWLEHALAGRPVEVTYQHGLDETVAAVDARRRRRGRADPAGERRRDRAHGPRGPADAAEVDVLHPQVAHRLRHPPALNVGRGRSGSADHEVGLAGHEALEHVDQVGVVQRDTARRRPAVAGGVVRVAVEEDRRRQRRLPGRVAGAVGAHVGADQRGPRVRAAGS